MISSKSHNYQDGLRVLLDFIVQKVGLRQVACPGPSYRKLEELTLPNSKTQIFNHSLLLPLTLYLYCQALSLLSPPFSNFPNAWNYFCPLVFNPEF